MPNWCQNSVTIKQKDLHKILPPEDDGSYDASSFTYNTIVPQPEIQDNVDLPGVFFSESPAPIHIPDSGLNDWYHWNIANWGTKWDASDTCLILPNDPDHGEAFVELSFDSPWGPPGNYFDALAEKYPDLDIEIHSFECGVGLSLYAYNDNGTMIVEDVPYSNNPLAFGYEDEEEEDSDEELTAEDTTSTVS